MEKWRGKNAVIIGANSGIGAATTYAFLENGINVYAWDKETSYLEELKEDGNENLTVLQTDITVDDEIQNSISYLDENTTSIDIVVFTAGIIENNSLIDGEFSEWEDVLNTNFVGFCVCMKGILNLMIKQNVKDGQVIVMSSKNTMISVAVHRGHYYFAIDKGIMAAVESMKYELKEKKSPIKISVISVGLVKTNLFKSELSKAVLNICIPLIPDDVVDAIDYILGTPKNLLVNRIVVAGRGFMRQHIFKSPGDKVVEKISKLARQR